MCSKVRRAFPFKKDYIFDLWSHTTENDPSFRVQRIIVLYHRYISVFQRILLHEQEDLNKKNNLNENIRIVVRLAYLNVNKWNKIKLFAINEIVIQILEKVCHFFINAFRVRKYNEYINENRCSHLFGTYIYW